MPLARPTIDRAGLTTPVRPSLTRPTASGATAAFLQRRRTAQQAPVATNFLNLSSGAGASLRASLSPVATAARAPVVSRPAPTSGPVAAAAPVTPTQTVPSADPASELPAEEDTLPAAVTAGIEGVEDTKTLRELSEQELALLLDGIAARFGLNREQLLAQENQLGIAARGIIQQAGRAQEEALEASSRTFQERGILRSGLRAKDVGRIGQATAGVLGAAEEQRLGVQNQIDIQRAALEGQLLSEQAATQQAVESGLLQFEEGQTVADLLATLPQVPGVSAGPLAPAAPLVSQPVTQAPPTLAQLLQGITAQAGSSFSAAPAPAPVGVIAGPGGTSLTPAPAQGSTGGLTSLSEEQLLAALSGLITGL